LTGDFDTGCVCPKLPLKAYNMISSNTFIVHATDIHFSSRTSSHCEEVIGALNTDLQAKLSGKKNVPMVVSGDIAQSGDSFKDYEGLATLLLDVVDTNQMKACTVPGNHDVSREFVGKNYANILGISSNHHDWQSLSHYLDGQEDFFREAMSEYIKFEGYFDGLKCCQNSVFGSGYILESGEGIFLLNSGFSSFGGLELGGRTSDYGNLLLNLGPIKNWIRSTPEIEHRILSMHHPLAWYREDVRGELTRIIDQHFGAVLLGHEHNPLAVSTSGFLGANTVTLQGGALASNAHSQQFYQLIEIDVARNQLSTHIRHFSKSHVSFNAGTTITGTPSGIKLYDSVWTSPKNRKFQKAISKHQKRLERTLSSSVQDDTVMYVEPSLTRKPIQKYEKKSSAQRHSLDDICQLKGNILINTPSQYGGSVLAYSIGLTLLRKGTKCLIVSADELPRYKAAVPKFLKKASEDIEFDCAENIEVFVIDDFDASNSSHVKNLSLLSSSCQNSQIIFLNKEVKILASSAVFDSVEDSNIFNLNALSKTNVRQLISKHPAMPAFTSLDEITEKVIIEVERLNLHRNAFTVLMITDIFAKDGVYNPLNRAKLVKRYFEEIFNKDGDSYGYTEELDFEDNMHLLTEFTGSLLDQDEFSFTADSWEEFCIDFKKRFGGKWRASDALDFYIGKQIFKKGIQKYHFSQGMWTWYFLALKANKDQDFKKRILKDRRYLAFPQVIEFASGLSRNDSALLDVLSDDLSACITNYRAESKLSEDFRPYDDFVLSAEEKSLEEFNRTLVQQVSQSVPNVSHLDEQADELYNFGQPFEQIVKSTIYTENLIRLFKALETTALCIRNLDQNLLEERLKACKLYLDGLELFSQAWFLSIPTLVRNGRAYVSGMAFVLNYEADPLMVLKSPEEEFRRRELNVILATPGRISETMLESLGSARLWADMEAPDDFDVSDFSKILLCMAHIELKNIEWFDDVLRYINYFDQSSIYLEIVKGYLARSLDENAVNDLNKQNLSHALAGAVLRQRGVKRVTEAACAREWSSIMEYKTTKKLTGGQPL